MWMAAKADLKKKGIRHHPMDECLNCQSSLDESHLFCPECGQKIHNSKLTIWSLIAEFFSGLFNIDNGFYRTLKCLPIPGYLSLRFMEGKRKRYINPIRFFLITLIVHITVITGLLPLDEVSRGMAKNYEDIGQKILFDDFQDQKDSLGTAFDACDLDSLQTLIFANRNNKQDSITINDPDGSSNFNSIFLTKGYRFAYSDLFDMPVEEFLTVYGAQTSWERLFMTQVMRTARDPSGAIRFGIGNLIWSILSTILILGFFMKLLYVRRNRFYVEHLIVLFNIHSFAFLLASLGLYVGFTFVGIDNDLGNIAYLGIFLFFFLSIKRYYKQGWIKSFLKFVMIGFVYLILLMIMIVSVTIIGLFFFK